LPTANEAIRKVFKARSDTGAVDVFGSRQTKGIKSNKNHRLSSEFWKIKGRNFQTNCHNKFV
jgi:hypothetical protein